MFRFVKKVFSIGLTILSGLTSANTLSCISMNNQACKARRKIVNVNSNNTMKHGIMTWHNPIKWHEPCKCECRLDAIVCNNKQRWNKNKCRCECKELIDKGICDKGFIWNPSNCECECDKSCDIGEYLDYRL